LRPRAFRTASVTSPGSPGARQRQVPGRGDDSMPVLASRRYGPSSPAISTSRSAPGSTVTLPTSPSKAERNTRHGDVAMDGRLDQSAREVLTEVGNVILSSCLSAFGDMLHVAVSFSVPRIHVESLEGLLRSLKVDRDELHYTLLAATRFRLTEGEVGGYLMIAVGLSSLDLINKALAEHDR